jgi:putative DNA primase/helicase
LDLLRALAAEAAPSKREKLNGHTHASSTGAWTEPDVDAFLVRGGIEAAPPESHNGALRWKLKRCPFNPEHGPTESAVFLNADGVLGFKCMHNSCADRHWADLRALVDGPREIRRSGNPRSTPHREMLGGDDRVNGHSDETALALRRASDVQIEPIAWLWSGWLAAGKLHVLAGVPGTGKTTVALSLAAIATRGGRWPDGTPFLNPGQVVMWSGEDGIEDTLAPRLTAMGADLTRVHFVGDVIDSEGRRAFDPATDMPALIAKARQVGDVRLLIVDPIVNTIAGDTHKNTEVRRGLAPLVEFGQKLNAAVLGISHFSKGTAGRDPLDRITGSLAFGALARLVFGAAKKTDEESGNENRLFVRIKSNIGPDGGGLSYTLATAELPQGIETSKITWGAKLEGNARDILADAEEPQEDSDERSALDEAKHFLRTVLGDGRGKASQIFKEAKEAGHSERTIRRAKADLRIVAAKEGMAGGWVWKIPLEPNPAKMAKTTEQKTLATFDGFGHLRDSEGSDSQPNGAVSQPGEDRQESPKMAKTPEDGHASVSGNSGHLGHLREEQETF